MENNTQMNHPAGSSNEPVSRNWLPIIIIVAIVAIGLVAWGMSRNGEEVAERNGTDTGRVTDDNSANGNDGTMNEDDRSGNSSEAISGTAEGDLNATVKTPSETVVPGSETDTRVITVTAGNFTFSPTEIRVKKGETIKIVLDNKEGIHDFVIDEFNAKTKQIQGPGTVDVTFTADKAGTFEYYCSVGKHRAMGMKGNLIVE